LRAFAVERKQVELQGSWNVDQDRQIAVATVKNDEEGMGAWLSRQRSKIEEA
jgi:hypothetical protein